MLLKMPLHLQNNETCQNANKEGQKEKNLACK